MTSINLINEKLFLSSFNIILHVCYYLLIILIISFEIYHNAVRDEKYFELNFVQF